jgi:acyl-CoA thioester hydrolase
VYYEDTDAQGLVYYANYFRFMERARTEWVRSLGIEQDRLLQDDRRCFVVVDVQARFISPAKFNDHVLVTVQVLETSRASFLLEQQIFRDNFHGTLLCRGNTRVAFIDADTNRPVRLPAILMKDSDA